MKKQPERTERTRQALIDSFWKLYLTKKIEKITVQEIVDGAGVYRSTFYEYFQDVYDVLGVIENRLLEDFQKANERTLGAGNLEELMENMLAFYELNGEHIAHLLSPGGDPVFSAKAMKIIKANLLERLRLEQNDLEADILFELIASSVITLLNYWNAHKEEATLREVFQTGLSLLNKKLISFFGTGERFGK